MTSHCPDASIGQYLMAVSHRDPSGRIRFPFDRAALIETIESTRDVSVRNWIADTARRGKPVLVLRGAESKVWLREEFDAEKRALAEFPHVIFKEFAGAGHGLPFEKRAEFVAELRGFVAG
jgi:pimeloyl-ACP methyl ester carboxylesterase